VVVHIWDIIKFLIRSISSPKTAYMNISFEREAYTNDNNLEYLKDRKYFAWIKYLRKNK